MSLETLPGNRRLVALVAVAAVTFLAIALVMRACGGDSGSDGPPAAEAVKLMPADTLLYAGLSTDGDRDAVQRAADLAQRFGAYDTYRSAILQRLSGAEGEVNAERDVEPWVGDEAAFALMDSGNATAGSLVAIEVTDEGRARKFLERNPRQALRKVYKGHETIRYGQVTTAFVGGFLVIGQDPTVQAAIERDRRTEKSLADDPTYRRAVEGLPDGRVFTGYASADGVRRLLAPQGDVLGAASVMLDQPALLGVAIAAEAEEDDDVRLVVHSALDAQRQKQATPALKSFEPGLVDAVPGNAIAYLGASGVSNALQRLVVTAVGGSGQGSEVTELLGRLATDLDEETGGGLRDDLLKLFEGEVAVVIQPQVPAPVLSLITRTEDEAATRRTLDRLRDPLAKLLRPEGEAELRWAAEDVEGTEAWVLSLPNGARVAYAVAGGQLILSTAPDGIRQILAADESLEDADAFEDVLADRPESVGTLGFLDFSQLLELGEQTGLNNSRAYLRAREDLRKVRALGFSSTSGEGETTAEILVSIR
ncbi:MAG: DUF3352 domain-containing protein [Actinomycetota bacterium]|nr:DUF3352 domain-containing protein [Actinomycetota bacterium]